MYELTEGEFIAAIEAALASIPERFLDDLENVQIVAEDESDPARESYTGANGLAETLAAPGSSGRDHHPVRAHGEILGLYSGTPITRRGTGYGAVGVQPDIITIYKRPHERCFSTGEGVTEQIRKTVVHEVGHYFGMDEAQVRAMGY